MKLLTRQNKNINFQISIPERIIQKLLAYSVQTRSGFSVFTESQSIKSNLSCQHYLCLIIIK